MLGPPRDGLPIEDVGVAGERYAKTRADLLSGNVDRQTHCVALLRGQTPSNLSMELDMPGKPVTLTAQRLDRADVFVAEHHVISNVVAEGRRWSGRWGFGAMSCGSGGEGP